MGATDNTKKGHIEDFTDHHFSENASKLHDELDFEKIISIHDDHKPNKGRR